MPVWQQAVFGPCISSDQAPVKAVKTVRQRVYHAVCGSTQEAKTEAKTTVDRKKTTMVPTIRITVRHVRWDAAEVAGRVEPVFAGWTKSGWMPLELLQRDAKELKKAQRGIIFINYE
jgi:hypothetical protein